MGCTHSLPAGDEDATHNLMAGNNRGGERGRRPGAGRPLLPDRPVWTSDTPMTTEALEQQRAAFWDTAPSYEGQLEVWQALRHVCDPTVDVATAQVILDSAGVVLPSGRLADGAYDALGGRYVIPNYCLAAPTNVIETSTSTIAGAAIEVAATEVLRDASAMASADAAKGNVTEDAAAVSGDATADAKHGRPIKLTIRLSSNADVRLDINSEDRLFPQVTRALLAAHPPEIPPGSPANHSVRVRYVRLGRILQGEQQIGDLLKPAETTLLLQAMVTVMPTGA
ncbi:hypothetical protein THASP1DRAFT_31879 [Thamnocephalis sphaerospora]|uniref:DC-UbP/UBTD2 N-terminal domain-containing protein n=1 Tax=Thamnocephalis sphaerospora TaxID=78915 RepID=A0A4P9XM17_9FUNG|nr:hypothetical protein THASP1DRAFT_31879 [Thamnocephalis sphaerospora]|eukprot:RKP06300.1 hypothetical protein THASP1DRAFT_31879 [Thamnocephalis sphaerospora]